MCFVGAPVIFMFCLFGACSVRRKAAKSKQSYGPDVEDSEEEKHPVSSCGTTVGLIRPGQPAETDVPVKKLDLEDNVSLSCPMVQI